MSSAGNVGKLAYLADIFCHLNKFTARVLHNYLCTKAVVLNLFAPANRTGIKRITFIRTGNINSQ